MFQVPSIIKKMYFFCTRKLSMASNMNADGTVDEHLELVEVIQTNHDEAYLYVSQGLAYQEQKQYELARDKYMRGLEKIDKALSIRCNEDYCNGAKWDHAKRLQDKMKNSAQLIRNQLQGIPTQSGIPMTPPYSPPEPSEMPPSYDEACEHELLSAQRHASDPNVSIQTNGVVAKGSTNGHHRMSREVVSLFCIPDEVQIFFVSYDGSVSAAESQASLYIYQFVEMEAASEVRPPAWLQIGNWTYPLVPGQSPALESSYGAFLFPNVGAGRDSAVGVILPPSVTPPERAEFLRLLHELTALKEEKPSEKVYWKKDAEEVKPQAESYSDTISRGIVTGAEYLSAGIVKGASMSSTLISKGASKAREKIQPNMVPRTVDPRVRDGLKIAHDASGVALKATGFLVKRLGDLTLALGRQIAPHIREQGSRLLASTFKSDPKEAKDTMDGVLTVAAGGLQGFSTIYMGLENAARTLASSLSSETVGIVGHTYGSEVGEVVGNALFSIGNLALTTHNVQSLGVKSVAKRTAKDAGKAILKDYTEQVNLPKK